MSNKGFTLTELLAVIVILGLISVLAAPTISKELKKSEEQNKTIINEKIENAAHIYAIKEYGKDLINGDTITFTLSDLVEAGLINLKDSCANKLDDQIEISNGEYDYTNIESENCYSE